MVGARLYHDLRQNIGVNLDASGPLSIGTTYHFALLYDGTHKWSYKNGVLQLAPTADFNGAVATDQQLSLGGATFSPTDGMIGVLEDVRVYNRNLSQKEVEGIYLSNGRDAIYDGLTNWWTMNNGGEGSIVTNERDLISKIDMVSSSGSPTYVKSPRSFKRWLV
jgi:hypothetical protein